MPQIHKHYMCILTVLLFMMAGITTQAQDLIADLTHIRQMLKNPDHFLAEMKVDIEYDPEFTSMGLPQSIHTMIKIDHGNYFYENEMASMVINQHWVVGVMHGQKQIVYGRNNSHEIEKARKMAFSKDIPTDPGLASKAILLGVENGSRHYRIDNPGNGLKQIDMYISTTTGFFTQLVNEYANPSKMGVKRTTTVFLQFNEKASFTVDEFSEKKFIRFAGQTAMPIEKYKTYQIIYTDPDLLKNF